MAVHPAHRLCGIGSQLMKAGIKKADNLNLECWLEGSDMGKPLYEKFGFQSLLKVAFDTELSGATDEWRRCAHEMTPAAVFAMWRPRQGVWRLEDGQDVGLPWTLGCQPVLNGASH
jgi:predicted N-acetyltransferase YhbS